MSAKYLIFLIKFFITKIFREKMSKNKKHSGSVKKNIEQTNFLDSIPTIYKELIAFLLILIPLLIYYIPYETENVRPLGSDYLSIIGQTHIWHEWQDKTGETVLWNPNIFAGEPIYERITPKIALIDTLLAYLGKIFFWVFWYMLLGGLGIYALLRYKKIPWYFAATVAVVFILLPDWQALIGTGHNSKLRAIMILPWFILSFDYFFEKRNLLSAGLFAFVFAMFNRTHHFQIVFYGILLLVFLYIYPTIKLLIEKKYKEFGKLALLFTAALILTVMTAAQPLLSTNEYAQYSTRGGHPLNIGSEAKSAEKSSGVSFEYATRWSFSPNEILDFFIPHFSGGLQSEKYDGSKFPQLKGREVPGYWGEKPFNGNYATMGAILFIFAIFGLYYYRKDKFVVGLSIFIIFSLLLSFGRHFPALYKLFFYYFPYFSKFRAPSMLVNITFVATLILSGYGLKAFLKQAALKDIKFIAGTLGVFLAIALYVLLFSSSFAFATPMELSRYNPQTMNIVKQIRQEFLQRDTIRLLIILILFSGVALGYLYKKLKVEYFIIATFILAVFEISGISLRAYNLISLQNPDKLEQSDFAPTPITNVLTKADNNYRALVLGREFTSNHYAYFYPLISGYSAIKLQAIQDIFDHALFNGDSPSGLNWNVINLLSGKYIISDKQINDSSVVQTAYDNSRKEFLYENSRALPKAWFVKSVKTFDSNESLVLSMNKNDFHPETEAFLLKKYFTDKTYSGTGKIKLTAKNPNMLEFTYESDAPQFAAVSGSYYPKGWKAFVDGKEVPLYETDFIIRGVEVPAGKHKLKLVFQPETYFASMNFVWIGNILILLFITVPLILEYKKRAVKS